MKTIIKIAALFLAKVFDWPRMHLNQMGMGLGRIGKWLLPQGWDTDTKRLPRRKKIGRFIVRKLHWIFDRLHTRCANIWGWAGGIEEHLAKQAKDKKATSNAYQAARSVVSPPRNHQPKGE